MASAEAQQRRREAREKFLRQREINSRKQDEVFEAFLKADPATPTGKMARKMGLDKDKIGDYKRNAESNDEPRFKRPLPQTSGQNKGTHKLLFLCFRVYSKL